MEVLTNNLIRCASVQLIFLFHNEKAHNLKEQELERGEVSKRYFLESSHRGLYNLSIFFFL